MDGGLHLCCRYAFVETNSVIFLTVVSLVAHIHLNYSLVSADMPHVSLLPCENVASMDMKTGVEMEGGGDVEDRCGWNVRV